MGKNNFLFFIAFFSIVCITFGFIEKLSTRPQCMHQWAQADRASIARNYADEDMNFFLPRVHNCMNESGITGVEFPIIQYTVAIFYKLFGFNELWYRLTMLLLVGMGVLFAFKIALCLLGENKWLSLSIALIWYSSPALVFYTPNFIPDAGSLGLSLTAWYFFFSYLKTAKRANIVLFFITLSLSSLIKITSFIGSITIITICIISLFKPKLFNLKKNTAINIAVTTIVSMIVTCIWYMYASWLKTKYGSEVFMLNLNPIDNLSQLPTDLYWLIYLWGSDYYSYPTLLIGMLMLLFCLSQYKSTNKLLLTITLLYAVGSFLFIILMMKQFVVHDYYVITLLPTAFFLLLTFVDVFYKTQNNFVKRYQKVLAMALVIITLSSLLFAKIIVNKRYAHQFGTLFKPEQMEGMEAYLRSIGITRNDKVVSMYDVSPNVSLYLMNVKGITFSPKIMSDSLIVANQSKKMNYLITTGDTVNVNYIRSSTKIGEKNGFIIYKFNSPY
ncbi:MAG: hypothetical protein MUE96_09875 [Bacteroidia bacterium]|jgi:hypothetical protein|nr:hypothetical protein [Bacteroidia bacterium]